MTIRPLGRVTRTFLGHIEGFWREHRPEDTDYEVEALTLQIL